MSNTDEFKVDLLKVAQTLKGHTKKDHLHEGFDLTEADTDRLLGNFDVMRFVLQTERKTDEILEILTHVMSRAESDEEAVFLLYVMITGLEQAKQKLKGLVGMMRALDKLTEE